MAKPIASLISELEGKREGEFRFQSDTDFDGQNRWIVEQIKEEGAVVHLLPRSSNRSPEGPTQTAGVDELYGDIISIEHSAKGPDKETSARINFRAYADHQPSKQLLKKWGIDEKREIAFYFPSKALQEAGLITPEVFRGLNIGDLIFWDNTYYVADNVHRSDYFGQTDKFFFTVAFCSRYHLQSTRGT